MDKILIGAQMALVGFFAMVLATGLLHLTRVI